MAKISNLDLLIDEDIQVIRQRQFSLEEDDDSRDDEINEMTQEDICACLVGWKLGSDSWFDWFVDAVARVTGKTDDEIKEALFNDSEK